MSNTKLSTDSNPPAYIPPAADSSTRLASMPTPSTSQLGETPPAVGQSTYTRETNGVPVSSSDPQEQTQYPADSKARAMPAADAPVQFGYVDGIPPVGISGAGPPLIRSAASIGAQYQAELFARCARGEHQRITKFGPCGIITGIVLFPIGLICLFLDTRAECSRCGVHLD